MVQVTFNRSGGNESYTVHWIATGPKKEILGFIAKPRKTHKMGHVKGGYTSCRFLVVKNTMKLSNIVALNAA